MKTVVLMATLMLAAVLQAVWPAWGVFGQSKVPVLPAVVLYYTLTRPPGMTVLAALGAGLLQDALSRTPLGYSSFIYLITAAAMTAFKELIFVHKTMTHIVIGALGNLMMTLGMLILLSVGNMIQPTPGWVVRRLGGALLLGILAVPILMAILDWVDRSLGLSEERGRL